MNFDRRVNFLKKSWQKLNNRFSSIQIIVFYYLAMTILSLILFHLPIFREPGSHVPFLDMVFMAISTISVTGLTTFDINSVFNDTGVLMLEVLFHIGGLGIMMITTFFFIVSKRRITLKQRQLIMTDMNQPRLSGIVNLIRITFTMLLAIEVLFGTIFSVYFYLAGYYQKLSEAIFLASIRLSRL